MRHLVWIIPALALLLPHAAAARNAEIMLLPTRVVMESGDQTSTLVIQNTGDAAGEFSIELVDMKMGEDGVVMPYAAGETPQFSAIPYIHIAPRTVMLKPGDTQNVRILLRKPADLPPGEYRAHVKVRLVNDNADTPAEAAPKDGSIPVKTNLIIIIPVIIRNGMTSLTMGIDQPRLIRDKDGKPSAVNLYLTRTGDRSSMGDISVTCTEGGKTNTIKFYPGVSVYRPTPRRYVSVPLDETPQNVNLSTCKLGVVYAMPEKDGGAVLAQAGVAKD